MSRQLELEFSENYKKWSNQNPYHDLAYGVPFVNEVETFNKLTGKPNNYKPIIPEKKEWQFVYDFIQEELEEYKEACENGDIVEVLEKRSKEQGEDCHWEKVNNMYIVYRTRDRKVMKSINYFRPDLTKFFTDAELSKFN